MKQEHNEDSSDNPVLYNCQFTGWAGSKIISLLLALSLATVPIYLTKNNKILSCTWGFLSYIVYSFPTSFWLPFSYQYCLVLPQIVTQTRLKFIVWIPTNQKCYILPPEWRSWCRGCNVSVVHFQTSSTADNAVLATLQDHFLLLRSVQKLTIKNKLNTKESQLVSLITLCCMIQCSKIHERTTGSIFLHHNYYYIIEAVASIMTLYLHSN